MKIALTLLLALSGVGFAAQAQDLTGDAARGAKINAACTGCHGISGYKSSSPEVYHVPAISGQNAKYIATALNAYKTGERKHPTMRGIAETLTEQDIADISAYYEKHGKDDGGPMVGDKPSREPNAQVAALLQKAACASCHKVHTAKDPVLTRQTQSRVCFDCHAKEQAKFQQASHHPVREGQMACTECHDVHGEKGTGAMIKASAREKRTSCHAEKRGPFLWEHAPAAEDCNLCHTPQGSNHASQLKKRAPLLCQECHSPAGHPSGRYDGGTLAGSAFLGAKGCANCHSQVHGSNHPSGVTQLR